MKKLLLVLFLLVIFFVGCKKEIVENRIDNEKTIPTISKNINNRGDIIVTTHISNSKYGSVPLIKIDKKIGLWKIKILSTDFDDSRLSYIYIDGKLNSIEKLGKKSKKILNICDSEIEKGLHKIEVIQFDNDKTSGKPINYKSCNYKIVLNKV